MCGIFGVIANNKFKSGINNLLNRCLDTINHRGPDNSSLKIINNNIALGHTRLAIIDLEKISNQPFSDEDDNIKRN